MPSLGIKSTLDHACPVTDDKGKRILLFVPDAAREVRADQFRMLGPASINPEDYAAREKRRHFCLSKAGEMLCANQTRREYETDSGAPLGIGRGEISSSQYFQRAPRLASAKTFELSM